MRKIITLIFCFMLSVCLFAQNWDQLSEVEKYAVAFSSNLFELNKENHFDFSNQSEAEEGKQILKDSWGITDYESLIENFKTLEEGGHSGAYDTLLALQDKHIGKKVLEIAHEENLDVLQTTRLYYVSVMRYILGSHGIEAWDEGREITILRWGIGAGYISYDEAIKLIEPVVERIKKNYVSWDDYMAHYIAGRGFYGLYDCNYTILAEKAVSAAEKSRNKIPVNELFFSAENADKRHVMNFDICFYLPLNGADEWERVQLLYKQEPSEQVLTSLENLEKEFPACKGITFYWHLDLLRKFSDSKNVVNYIEENSEYWTSLPSENGISVNTKFAYMYALNDINQPQKAIEVFETFPDSVKMNVYVYYQYACSYYIMAVQTPVDAERFVYGLRAVNAFKQCEKLGLELNDFVKNWIKSVQ
jgi:hypothetical protein